MQPETQTPENRPKMQLATTGAQPTRKNSRTIVITSLLVVVALLAGYVIGNLMPLPKPTPPKPAVTNSNKFVPICQRPVSGSNYQLTVVNVDTIKKTFTFRQEGDTFTRGYCDNTTVVDGHTGSHLKISDLKPGSVVNISSNNDAVISIEVITL